MVASSANSLSSKPPLFRRIKEKPLSASDRTTQTKWWQATPTPKKPLECANLFALCPLAWLCNLEGGTAHNLTSPVCLHVLGFHQAAPDKSQMSFDIAMRNLRIIEQKVFRCSMFVTNKDMNERNG
jgi:hypothetical protein